MSTLELINQIKKSVKNYQENLKVINEYSNKEEFQDIITLSKRINNNIASNFYWYIDRIEKHLKVGDKHIDRIIYRSSEKILKDGMMILEYENDIDDYKTVIATIENLDKYI